MSDELFEKNAKVMEQMDSQAAAIISATLRCIEKQGTKILLKEPYNSGNSVKFEMVAGEWDQVWACADECGVKNITKDSLEM